jgi:hypothetical protein
MREREALALDIGRLVGAAPGTTPRGYPVWCSPGPLLDRAVRSPAPGSMAFIVPLVRSSLFASREPLSAGIERAF